MYNNKIIEFNQANAWGDERVAMLRQLLGQGKSAAQIAAAIGGVTRNAVIGKIHRTKDIFLVGSRSRPNPSGPKPIPSKPRRKRIVIDPAPSIGTPEPILTGQRLTVGIPQVSLSQFQCKWPVNEADRGELHLFCGAPKDRGNYCEEHQRLVYNRGPRVKGFGNITSFRSNPPPVAA